MKKLFLLFLLLASTSIKQEALAQQNNLIFSQVILVDLASNATQAVVVPAGKVWKIESVGAGVANGAAIMLRNSSGQNVAYFGNNPSSTVANPSFPFWLPSGFIGSFQNAATARGTVSIVEYTVVP